MPKAKSRKVGPVYRVFTQDLYSTGLHIEEFGYRQVEMWRSKSRQFSRDADIIGKIEEGRWVPKRERVGRPERAGFIILRRSLWNDMDDLEKRLVVKLFNNSGSWLATMEEMVADEYTQSFAADQPLVSFVVLTNENEIITQVRQSRRGSVSTENFSFYLLGPEGSFEAFRIEGIRASLGDDFKVIRLNGHEEVARIDSKFGDLGGEFTLTIRDPVLAENEWFCRILQCFSVMIAFRGKIREKIDKGFNKWKKGKFEPSLHRYEVSLLANPRRLTLKTDELEEV
ncbi:MAG: hypothetical protein DRP09_00435 [Candidatus Thorarchaeota archaeon]|nr:MAG: hypothetical protein DRP09_00435 [Candidatus Thorarchaeota archaeon]